MSVKTKCLVFSVLLILFSLFMWFIYATNRRLEHPSSKFKAKKMLVSYLEKLPLQDLINTGRQANFLHEQDKKLFDGLVEQRTDANFVSFLENKETVRFVGVLKEAAVAGIQILFEHLSKLFSGEAARPEESTDTKIHAEGRGSSPATVVQDDMNANADHFQPGLEGSYPSEGYEEQSPGCWRTLDETLHLCLGTPEPFAKRPMELYRIRYTHAFKRLDTFLRHVKKAQDSGIPLNRDQVINAAKMVAEKAAAVHDTGSTPMRKGFRKSLNYAESLLKGGVE
eukprot:g12041.t1